MSELSKARLNSPVLKETMIRPLVLAANKALRRHVLLKQRVSFWLFRNFPDIHHHLRSLVHQQALTSTKALRAPARPAVAELPDRSLKVLSDPGLATLEWPTTFPSNRSDPNRFPNCNDNLEPIVELVQMRQSHTSVCFVVPVFHHDRDALERTVQAILKQTDPAWELLLCATPECTILAEEWLDIDWRIRRLSSTGGHEVACMLQAAVDATAEFVGMLSQGDVIDDDLVKRLGQAVHNEPEIALIYTDEMQRLADGTLTRPYYKPDWSPEHQCSVNMLGRFLAIRKALLLDQSVPISRNPEAAEYELNLGLTRQARKICHVDDALYIRNAAEPLAIGNFFADAALPEARSALERHIRAENAEARVIIRPEGSLHVRWPLPPDVPVTLLILTGMHEREIPGRGRIVLATNFVRSIIDKSSLDHYKIIVVDDGYVPDDLRELLERHGHSSHTAPKYAPFSFAHKANFASALVKTGVAILLNDDLEVISPDWIQELASQAVRPSIGAVGAKLLFADGLLQHAGIAMGFHGSAGHIFHRVASDGREYGGFASIDRNYSAVTGAVLAYRKEVFDELGGFDETFRTDYNDVDFCLRCIKQGYRVVYTPAATLYHFHNSSLKRMGDKESERQAFLSRWNHVVARDPYFSRHFQTQSDILPLLID